MGMIKGGLDENQDEIHRVIHWSLIPFYLFPSSTIFPTRLIFVINDRAALPTKSLTPPILASSHRASRNPKLIFLTRLIIPKKKVEGGAGHSGVSYVVKTVAKCNPTP